LPYSVRPLCSATIPESTESTGEASPLKHPPNANMNTDINFSIYHNTIFFPMAQQPLVGQGLLINEASRSHSDTPH
jgi:hypothetical protein